MTGIVWLVIVGAAAGFLATRIMRVPLGAVETVALGIAGAVIGTVLLRVVLAITGLLGGLIGAVLGAIVLILVWQALRAR